MKAKSKLFAAFVTTACATIIILLITNNSYTARYNKTINYISNLEGINTTINNIQCSNEPLIKMVKQRGDFYVLSNYVQAEKYFRCNESITFTTPGDYRFLDNLVPLVQKWRGPISVALYTPGYDFQATIKVISYLTFCTTPLIKEYISFHLFFEWYHMPEKLSNLFEDINCSEGPPNIDPENTYKNQNELTYPINTARNIAKHESSTYFILAADIELVPTPNLIESFLLMITEQPNRIFNGENNVFVLPLFEIPEDQQIPNTKTKLQQMTKNHTAFVFHKKLCNICHMIPKYDKWIKTAETEKLDIFTTAKRKGKYKTWEPFYIGTSNEPDFDERLTWEGQSNKMTQGYLMCVLDYNYMILNNAFLVHKPGIKKSKLQLKRYAKLVMTTNKLIKNVIKPELDTMYGTLEGCKL